MGWGRTFLLGDVGNRLDISDCEADIRVLKESLMEIHHEGQNIDSELLTLQRENDHIKLYLASITRLLITRVSSARMKSKKWSILSMPKTEPWTARPVARYCN